MCDSSTIIVLLCVAAVSPTIVPYNLPYMTEGVTKS